MLFYLSLKNIDNKECEKIETTLDLTNEKLINALDFIK